MARGVFNKTGEHLLAGNKGKENPDPMAAALKPKKKKVGMPHGRPFKRGMEISKEQAEASFEHFCRLVHPDWVLAPFHQEIAGKLTNYTKDETGFSYLLLSARGHLKSTMAATYAAWRIVRNPCIRIQYVCHTQRLAIIQLRAIRQILESDAVSAYWPELILHKEIKHRREEWAKDRFIVDHPSRQAKNIKESTVWGYGLGVSATGTHCNLIIYDDVVVESHRDSFTERENAKDAVGALEHVLDPGGDKFAVGTPYHPDDVYHVWRDTKMPILDLETLEEIGEKNVWDIDEYPVTDKDGNFIFPKHRSPDGNVYGFDAQELLKRKADFLQRGKERDFYPQYYLKILDDEAAWLVRDDLQYYKVVDLKKSGRYWYHNKLKLRIAAAVDLAYTAAEKATIKHDHTTIAVMGIDPNDDFYLLDIARFQTKFISDIYKELHKLYVKWGFTDLRAECNNAQNIVVAELQRTYLKKDNVRLKIDEFHAPNHEGKKVYRINSLLEPIYRDKRIFHPRLPWQQEYEKELLDVKSKHDDIKDAVSNAIILLQKLGSYKTNNRLDEEEEESYGGQYQISSSPFGGIV